MKSSAQTFFSFLFQEHFNWSSTICMGHSMGAGVSYLYAATYPERVSRLIMIDLIGFGSLPLKKHSKATRKAIDISIKLNHKVKNTTEDKLPRYKKSCFHSQPASFLLLSLQQAL